MRLLKRRYNEIEQVVLKLFSIIKVRRFPISCVDICRQLRIVLYPYSTLSEKKREAAMKESKDGFYAIVELQEGVLEYRIYYNDTKSRERIRFTIMHEVGHIMLDHLEHSTLAETEANYFAGYALAPPPVVSAIGIEDYIELSEKFDISLECALYAMRRYIKWREFGAPYLLDHENEILMIFQPLLC